MHLLNDFFDAKCLISQTGENIHVDIYEITAQKLKELRDE